MCHNSRACCLFDILEKAAVPMYCGQYTVVQIIVYDFYLLVQKCNNHFGYGEQYSYIFLNLKTFQGPPVLLSCSIKLFLHKKIARGINRHHVKVLQKERKFVLKAAIIFAN